MEENKTREEETTLYGTPILCGAFNSSGLYKKLKSNTFVPREELIRSIDYDRIMWRKRWMLWPFLYGAVVELFWPQLRRFAASRLVSAWLSDTSRRIKEIENEIEEILLSGTEAEEVVDEWLRNICKFKANTAMPYWVPMRSGIMEIVFPPSEINKSSQELDHLLVTSHGVYIIEVKGWRSIEEDGTNQTADGKKLKSPIEQCRGKVDHLRRLLGNGVPVKALAVLPRLDRKDVPFRTDSRILTSQDELELMLKIGNDQLNYKSKNPIDKDLVAQKLMGAMDTEPGAKLRHMLWLADHHPNEGATRIKNLYMKMLQLKEDISNNIEVSEVRRRPFALALALFASIVSYTAIEYPDAYKKYGSEVFASLVEHAPMDPEKSSVEAEGSSKEQMKNTKR